MKRLSILIVLFWITSSSANYIGIESRGFTYGMEFWNSNVLSLAILPYITFGSNSPGFSEYIGASYAKVIKRGENVNLSLCATYHADFEKVSYSKSSFSLEFEPEIKITEEISIALRSTFLEVNIQDNIWGYLTFGGLGVGIRKSFWSFLIRHWF